MTKLTVVKASSAPEFADFEALERDMQDFAEDYLLVRKACQSDSVELAVKAMHRLEVCGVTAERLAKRVAALELKISSARTRTCASRPP